VAEAGGVGEKLVRVRGPRAGRVFAGVGGGGRGAAAVAGGVCGGESVRAE